MQIPIPTSWTDTGLSWEFADPMWPNELVIPCLIESIKEKSPLARTVGFVPSMCRIFERYRTQIPSNSALWQSLNYLGAHDPGTLYHSYDCVLYNNCYWVRSSVSGNDYELPGVGTRWERMQYAVGLYTSFHDFDAAASAKPFKVFFEGAELSEAANKTSLTVGSWCFDLISGSGRYRLCIQPPHYKYNNMDYYMSVGYFYEGVLEVQMSESSERKRVTYYNPLYSNFEYVFAIYSCISTLIPKFVNFLDNGGYWTGRPSIPNLTEQSALNIIGDSARIVPAHMNVLSNLYFQSYKLLNLLRWIKITHLWPSTPVGLPENMAMRTTYDGHGMNGSSWADAISKYMSNGWDGYYTQHGLVPQMVYHWATRDAAHWAVFRTRGDVTLLNDYGLSFLYDFYLGLAAYGTFDCQDYSLSEPGVYKLQSGELPAGSNDLIKVGYIDNVTLSEPEANSQRGYTVSSSYSILKFDNEFKFKNW